jgi:hypothetical protein
MRTMVEALNRLVKWRLILAGWQLGTRRDDDPETQAVRDIRELLLILRTEVNALTRLCLDKGVFTAEEFERQVVDDAEFLEQELEKKFPGAKATDAGMSIKAQLAHPWMSRFPP